MGRRRTTGRTFERKHVGSFQNRPTRSYFGVIAWLVIASGCAVLFFANRATQESTEVSISAAGLRVIDGDTVGLADGRRVRLIDYQTPEIFEPRCPEERALGVKATQRLRQLIQGGQVEVRLVACSCDPRDANCNYGRECGRLSVDGMDVGSTLISEGLAKPYVCGFGGCPPRESWC